MDVSSGPVFLSKKRRIGSRCELRANLPQEKKKESSFRNWDSMSSSGQLTPQPMKWAYTNAQKVTFLTSRRQKLHSQIMVMLPFCDHASCEEARSLTMLAQITNYLTSPHLQSSVSTLQTALCFIPQIAPQTLDQGDRFEGTCPMSRCRSISQNKVTFLFPKADCHNNWLFYEHRAREPQFCVGTVTFIIKYSPPSLQLLKTSRLL